MMLTQFRIHYPQGSIISELVTIDHGKYIVRVLVQVGTVTLATGLAGADTIEAAEDSARHRALALLNLDPIVPNSSHQPQSSPSVVPSPPPEPTTVTTPEPSFSNNNNVQTPSSEPVPEASVTAQTVATAKKVTKTPKVTQKKPEPALAPEESLAASPPESLSPPPTPEIISNSPEIVSPPISEIISDPSETASPSPSPITSTPETITNEEVLETATTTTISEEELETVTPEASPPLTLVEEPLDFSEIIARSDAQMKRLGWTKVQGRDYLVQTYGKRSRQVLSDEELIEFLHYLESLPTPS